MQFDEMGIENGKNPMLLPGTAWDGRSLPVPSPVCLLRESARFCDCIIRKDINR